MPATKIDLHLPECWDELTTKQMEWIARCYGRNPNKKEFLVEAFIFLSGLKICDRPTHKHDVEGIYTFRRSGFKYWFKRERFNLRSWEIQFWIDNHLIWLIEDCDRVISPYPYIRRWFRYFHGPLIFLQDFSWRQYKFANDYLKLYREEPTDKNRAFFLATIFTPKTEQKSPSTQINIKDFRYFPEQTMKYYRYFLGFPDYKFHCIMMFWDGVSLYLKKTFPHLYKESGNGTEFDDPIKSEAQISETLCTRMNLSSEQMYREPYTRVLENLERLFIDVEEYQKLKTKN